MADRSEMCAFPGCENESDPRMFLYCNRVGHPSCDAHGGCVVGLLAPLIAERDAIKARVEQLERALAMYAQGEAMARHISSLEATQRELVGLLKEWRETPFFHDKGDWAAWARGLSARVDAVLARVGGGK